MENIVIGFSVKEFVSKAMRSNYNLTLASHPARIELPVTVLLKARSPLPTIIRPSLVNVRPEAFFKGSFIPSRHFSICLPLVKFEQSIIDDPFQFVAV